MSRVEIDPKIIYLFVNRERVRSKLSWRELADILRVNPSTLTRMAKGGCPSTNTFATLLDWLNMPVWRFLKYSYTHKKQRNRILNRLKEIRTVEGSNICPC